jgi:hypothetical protein
LAIYKSKIGLEIVIPLVIILGGTSFLMIYKNSWFGLFIISLVVVFISHMLLTTFYKVDKNILTIKCGFLFNKEIEIKKIKKIEETNNILSSPAASLDRLAIFIDKYEPIMVSPKDKEGFIKELIQINADIEVFLKNEFR